MEQLTAPAAEAECRSAFATVRLAKNCLWWLVLLAVVVQLGGFVLVRFVDGIPEPLPQAAPAAEAVRAQTQPAGAASARSQDVGPWRRALSWGLGASKFTGLAGGTLLTLTLLLAVKLSLVGRTGGIAGFMGAFFTALVMWVFLVPWQQVANFSFACGALFNLGELEGRTNELLSGGSVLFAAVYYLRFVAYPLLVVGLLLVIQARFARGHRRMSLGVAQPEVPEKM